MVSAFDLFIYYGKDGNQLLLAWLAYHYLILWFNENRLKLGKFILLFSDVIMKLKNKVNNLHEDGKQLKLMQGSGTTDLSIMCCRRAYVFAFFLIYQMPITNYRKLSHNPFLSRLLSYVGDICFEKCTSLTSIMNSLFKPLLVRAFLVRIKLELY